MNEVFNAGWYAHNESVKYPLDSAASCRDNTGAIFPSTILTDLRLVTTRPGNYFLSGVHCTDKMISVVIADDAGNMVASFAAKQPITPYSSYVMNTDATMSAVIAFGAADTYGIYRFSSPQQSQLAPTCQILMQPWPVTSIQTDANNSLLGDVIWAAGNDVVITVEDVILGKTRGDGRKNDLPRTKAIIFRCQPVTDNEERSRRYLGTCAYRLDNNDCVGIQTLGGAVPDASGNLQIITEGVDLSLSFSAIPAYDMPDCKMSPNACITGNVAYHGEVKQSEPMEFGQCGIDACAEPEDTKRGIYSHNKTLLEEALPLNASVVSLSQTTGLSTETGEDAQIFVNVEDGIELSATFFLQENPIYSISWNQLCLKVEDNIASFGGHTLPITCETIAILRISRIGDSLVGYHNGTRIGKVPAETLTTGYASIKNCTITDWNVKQ